MLTSPRPPSVRRNARSILSSSSAATPSPHRLRRLLLLISSTARPPRCCWERHSGRLTTRTRTRTRCFKWEEYEYEYEDEDEEDEDLEAEILEFMRGSSKPEAFPSRRELVEAGREDLAEAIVAKGGWLSLGWDSDEDEAEEDISNGDSGTFERVTSSAWNNNNIDDDDDEEEEESSNNSGGAKLDDQEASSILSLYPEQEAGIEGILSRLEKQRNDSFRLGEDEEDGHNTHSQDTSSSSNDNTNFNHNNDDLIKPPPLWRSLTSQRASLSEIDIQDIEIEPVEISKDGILGNNSNESANNNNDDPREQNYLESRREEITQNQLRSRLQNLELELSSVLRSVRSTGDEIASHKDHDGMSNDLQKIYDTWEFQENEIMRAQDKLRSTRARLAVLEGKMALAIIEAQKIMEEKQKRIDNARRALRVLYSTCIVWPNPASEVLLAGSFDGWATLRKMEKSSTGLFSLWLQLYPGKYEIKFIVDGEWRIDPQRPTINNNSHLNNLLIIS